ncbi:hypothetical protein ABH924_002348 [Arthrobacter sp. GAS37]
MEQEGPRTPSERRPLSAAEDDELVRIRQSLVAARLVRARIDSSIRTLLRVRGERVALALADRLPVTGIAAASGIKRIEVKRVGIGYLELPFSGLGHDVHMLGLNGVARALAAAMDEKSRCEERMQAAVLMALRSGMLDVFAVASLTGTTAERIRETVRGAKLPTCIARND